MTKNPASAEKQNNITQKSVSQALLVEPALLIGKMIVNKGYLQLPCEKTHRKHKGQSSYVFIHKKSLL
ncbi:MAG: hypothetical protein COA44_09700 [Arcobacter sp.]|nr:MAG: hypothetical protein COA44_09700 [Arcobacter sp.]